MEWVAGSVQEYLRRWNVQRDGETIVTPSSWLVPGLWRGHRVMLKVARVEEEARAAGILAWWAGSGAAPVHEFDEHAVLMDLATGNRDLAAMTREGRDDVATRVLCETIATLHEASAHSAPPDGAVPLTTWFRSLIAPTRMHSPAPERYARIASEMLDGSPLADDVVLHGDIHHSNVLDFDGRWRAIDPKGLHGARAFDYANIFCNPDAASAVANFDRRLSLVSEHSGLERNQLRSWVLVWCALSMSWTEESGGEEWAAHAIMAEFG